MSVIAVMPGISKDAGDHLLAVINDLLDVSRIEMDRLQLDEEVLDVAKVIKACETLIKGRAHEAGLSLQAEIASPLPNLSGDALKIKQVLLNLLSNAIKFTPKGGHITLKAEIEENGQLVMSVADDGVGFDRVVIRKTTFNLGREGNPYRREVQGAGIGLPLSQKLVELHGGTLEISSEPGQGTFAFVRFPVDRLAW